MLFSMSFFWCLLLPHHSPWQNALLKLLIGLLDSRVFALGFLFYWASRLKCVLARWRLAVSTRGIVLFPKRDMVVILAKNCDSGDLVLGDTPGTIFAAWGHPGETNGTDRRNTKGCGIEIWSIWGRLWNRSLEFFWPPKANKPFSCFCCKVCTSISGCVGALEMRLLNWMYRKNHFSHKSNCGHEWFLFQCFAVFFCDLFHELVPWRQMKFYGFSGMLGGTLSWRDAHRGR